MSLSRLDTAVLQTLRDKLAGGAQLFSILKKHHLGTDPLLASLTTSQALAVLDLMLIERHALQRAHDGVELVWSGPETGATETRETAVVLRELFLGAKRSILVATFVFYDGDSIFDDLARRLDDDGIDVRFVLHAEADASPTESRRRCAAAFRQNWPGKTMPRIWIDPRTTIEAPKKTTMHAKFVSVDDEVVFLTSANFTAAAQERNVEAGALLRQPVFAQRLRRHIDGLIANKLLEPLLLAQA